ncbi:MAG: flagellar export chaperone FliS [Gemmatimonadetes bacterium]|nr:flagellar export chaperone FliS [Gemmatimonadota bacterium]
MSYAAVTKQATRYKEAEVLSATPGQLVLTIFDHILVNLSRARLRLDDKDGAARSEALERARAGLTELLVSLDRPRGGDIAGNLASLYVFWLGELSVLGVKPNAQRLDAIIAMITELRGAFSEVVATVTPPNALAVS